MKQYTLREMAGRGFIRLEQAGVESPRLDAELLLARVLGRNRIFLHLNPDFRPGDGAEREFLALVERRAAGEPLQYLTGVQEFMGLEFIVNPSVLIPRPDTETLVEAVLDWLEACRKTRSVPGPTAVAVQALDLGTGSGAIAVSLAFYCSGLEVKAVDISPEALGVARENARRHGVAERVQFLEGDLFSPFKRTGTRFDLIVSNPPYVSGETMRGLQREVRHEPRDALYGGFDGLDFYRRIAAGSTAHIKRGGLLAVEVGYDQAGAVQDIFLKTGAFTGVKIIRDLAGRDRVALATTL